MHVTRIKAQAEGACPLLRFPHLSSIRWLVFVQISIAVGVPLWVAYFIYLPAHTVLEFSSVSLRLTRLLPHREWSGSWRDVRRACYLHPGVFAIRTTQRIWPGWAIKVAPEDSLLVEELKRYLNPDVWIDRTHATRRHIGRVVLLAHVILIALALLVGFVERALR
jgi:hypothetical protein